jgi:hypothetical protein
MNKAAALAEVNRRSTTQLAVRDAHFANVNAAKEVWWLEIPRRKIFEQSPSVIDLVLAESTGCVHHLRVPKVWLIDHFRGFVVREDKDVVCLELSAGRSKFVDQRPTSARLSFASFLVI